MHKFIFTKIILFLALLTICSGVNAQIEGLPADFTASFDVSPKGVITPRTGVKVTDPKFSFEPGNDGSRVFSKSDDTTAWHVGSVPCPQNKQLNCVSVYNRDSRKIRGNQMNPFADEDHRGSYSLYRFNKDTGVLNSVIKCGSSTFTTTMTRDQANLKKCFEYTENKCKDWFKFINNESGLNNDDIQKAQQCVDIFAKIDRARIKMTQIFQSDLKDSQKDLESQFDNSTRGDRGLRIAASVTVNNSKPNPTLLNFQDLVERSNDCSTNAALFEKNKQTQYDYLRNLFPPVQGSGASGGTTRSGRGDSNTPAVRSGR